MICVPSGLLYICMGLLKAEQCLVRNSMAPHAWLTSATPRARMHAQNASMA
jgi:hypothetical protein